MIPFLDLRSIQRQQRKEILAACVRVLDSGWYVLGEEVRQFENEFANYCGANHCVGVGNGLDALTLVLRAWDIGPGDEVIVPSNTYIATWLAVTHVGATLVPVEPDPETMNIDTDRIEVAITSRTKAIIPVHLYGQPADIGSVMALAQAHGLRVLEDAAQAHGAKYRGQRLGAHGDAISWSFYPGKNFGALGDGGAVTTNDIKTRNRLCELRNYGSKIKYCNDVIGYNSRLDELQAALLRVKLPHLDSANQRRGNVARQYMEGLAGLGLRLPVLPEWAEPVWHLFTIRHPLRDRLSKLLADAGVGTMIHYPIPPHLQPAYAGLGYSKGCFPISESIHNEILSLPIGPTQTAEQTECVIAAVRQALRVLES